MKSAREGTDRTRAAARTRTAAGRHRRGPPRDRRGTLPHQANRGEEVVVTADIFADGHDVIAARVMHRRDADATWARVPMTPARERPLAGRFFVPALGVHHYTVEGWVDHFATWRGDLRKRAAAGQDVAGELLVGARLVEEAFAGARGSDARRTAAAPDESFRARPRAPPWRRP